VGKSYYPAGKNMVSLERNGLKPGLYIVRVTSGDSESIIKVLIN
jgi:hypothetical protein